jgi:hypothetical protein
MLAVLLLVVLSGCVYGIRRLRPAGETGTALLALFLEGSGCGGCPASSAPPSSLALSSME